MLPRRWSVHTWNLANQPITDPEVEKKRFIESATAAAGTPACTQPLTLMEQISRRGGALEAQWGLRTGRSHMVGYVHRSCSPKGYPATASAMDNGGVVSRSLRRSAHGRARRHAVHVRIMEWRSGISGTSNTLAVKTICDVVEGSAMSLEQHRPSDLRTWMARIKCSGQVSAL